MNPCEPFQINVSALLDGELPEIGLGATIQHLAACPTCLQEFQKFQALQRRVRQDLKDPAVPDYVWSSISAQQKYQLPTRVISPRTRTFRILASAAIILLCFGLGLGLGTVRLPLIDPKTPIVLASNPEEMTDEQFLNLTRELLTADPFYQQKMYLILHTLLDQTGEGKLETLKESDPSSLITPSTQPDGNRKATYKF